VRACELCALLQRDLLALITPFDSANRTHEILLFQLYTRSPLCQASPGAAAGSSGDAAAAFVGDAAPAWRHGKHWGRIGFQGDDPATDFRAVGVLGLHCLNAFLALSPLDAQALQAACDAGGLKYYNWSLFGIHLAAALYTLSVSSRALDSYYLRCGASIRSFFVLFSTLFPRFHALWQRERPSSVMEYGRVFEAFMRSVNDDITADRLHRTIDAKLRRAAAHAALHFDCFHE
jgi:hypothetical protein